MQLNFYVRTFMSSVLAKVYQEFTNHAKSPCMVYWLGHAVNLVFVCTTSQQNTDRTNERDERLQQEDRCRLREYDMALWNEGNYMEKAGR